MKSEQLIETLKLSPHPEGGYYRRTYESGFTTEEHRIQHRPLTTMIYYMLEAGQKSKFHRLKSDEIWAFHKGSPLIIHCLAPDGTYTRNILGDETQINFQLVVPAGTWFAAEPSSPIGYVLCSCIVNPGFDFLEFELTTKQQLYSLFPNHKEIIQRFS